MLGRVIYEGDSSDSQVIEDPNERNLVMEVSCKVLHIKLFCRSLEFIQDYIIM